MQAHWSEHSRSDDESIATYDSSVTAVSSRNLAPVESQRGAPYLSSSFISVGLEGKEYTLEPHQVRQRPARRRPLILDASAEPVASVDLTDEKFAALSSLPTDYLAMFPMPDRRAGESALRRRMDVPEILTPDLGDVDVTREGGALEAAWEDESCIDGSSPRMLASDRFADLPQPTGIAGGMQDRFEVDALRRQVEQLQMALQLQGQQLARAESHQSPVHRRPRTGSSAHQSQQSMFQRAPAPPTVALPPPPPQPSTSRVVHAPHNAGLPTAVYTATPSTGIAAPILLPPTQYRSVRSAGATTYPAQQQNYFDRPTTAPNAYHPFAADRQEADTPQSLSPSTSVSQTLFDVDKFDHLNRKVAELEMLIGAINVNQRPLPPPPPSSSTTTSPGPLPTDLPSLTNIISRESTAFHYNSTLPPTLSSSSSIRSSLTTASSSKESKGSKFAAALGMKKPSSISNHSSLSISQPAESRVSWSRKRTEKVAKPKAKVRQGPGRGRMVIREAAA